VIVQSPSFGDFKRDKAPVLGDLAHEADAVMVGIDEKTRLGAFACIT